MCIEGTYVCTFAENMKMHVDDIALAINQLLHFFNLGKVHITHFVSLITQASTTKIVCNQSAVTSTFEFTISTIFVDGRV